MLRIARRLEPIEGTKELTENDMMDVYDYLVKGNIEADEQYKEKHKFLCFCFLYSLRFE